MFTTKPSIVNFFEHAAQSPLNTLFWVYVLESTPNDTAEI